MTSSSFFVLNHRYVRNQSLRVVVSASCTSVYCVLTWLAPGHRRIIPRIIFLNCEQIFMSLLDVKFLNCESVLFPVHPITISHFSGTHVVGYPTDSHFLVVLNFLSAD